jgi:hypothetical protein
MSQAETDSTILPTPIPTSLNVTAGQAIRRRAGAINAHAARCTPGACCAGCCERSTDAAPAHSNAVTFATLVSAVSLASVSAFFGVTGMTAMPDRLRSPPAGSQITDLSTHSP